MDNNLEMGQLELILDVRAELAEGPIWDEQQQKLYWVDIIGCQVHCFDPLTGQDQAVNVAQMVGTVVLRAGGGLVLAMQRGFYFCDFTTGELIPIGDPEADLPDNRFNDGKCDPAGRFWAGTMGTISPRQPSGALYVLDPDLGIRKMIDGVQVSNGIVWSLDQRTMYYIDTPLKTVDAFDYDLASGTVANRRPVIRIAAGEGGPDGMAIDSEGMLWVAQWGGWQIGRYDPLTGKKLARIDLPTQHVSACAFGGPDLHDLYITTARENIPPEALASQPHAGSLFRIRTGVRGLPAFRFRG